MSNRDDSNCNQDRPRADTSVGGAAHVVAVLHSGAIAPDAVPTDFARKVRVLMVRDVVPRANGTLGTGRSNKSV